MLSWKQKGLSALISFIVLRRNRAPSNKSIHGASEKSRWMRAAKNYDRTHRHVDADKREDNFDHEQKCHFMLKYLY